MERPKLSIIIAILSLFIVAGSFVTVFSMRNSVSSASLRAVTAMMESDNDVPPLAIDDEMIAYRQTAMFRVDLKNPTSLAVGLDDQILVGGEKSILQFGRDGLLQTHFSLNGTPTCLAIGGIQHHAPGRIYVGMGDHVQVLNPSGGLMKIWPGLGEQTRLTSIGAAERDVFVADAGNRLIWRFDGDGKLQDPIGQPGPMRRSSGFRGACPCFDLVVGFDDLLYVANTGERRVEGYTFQGDREIRWGHGSPAIADFAGPENPTQLALLPDGRFVTAEQNAVRVKVYSSAGKFESVVCGPDQVSQVTDLATDRKKRVIVLDGNAACVRIFEAKATNESPTGESPTK